jgi:hypothetical protein
MIKATYTVHTNTGDLAAGAPLTINYAERLTPPESLQPSPGHQQRLTQPPDPLLEPLHPPNLPALTPADLNHRTHLSPPIDPRLMTIVPTERTYPAEKQSSPISNPVAPFALVQRPSQTGPRPTDRATKAPLENMERRKFWVILPRLTERWPERLISLGKTPTSCSNLRRGRMLMKGRLMFLRLLKSVCA